ncbi:sugar ABC transporter permease [Paenibacillus alginolyticus]|uniref:Sugar ABC transporter permease n=1 Tax=Paenibacillus alginolyticus TaxID=59839 RepID=A0ABT4GP44_9BACL|nr:sugar ABC transporter permease [Paenibacillus alginolyticus]MCY9665939.1 sugar ABC transporter permease [Paenibacillus alginolyticus]MCY9697900.1 sugar ABC transporter permease [Paenibacillus alginolyticus]MEC0145669.1 sugar ABC transporter permease [Paenibacillus alginolyticus]
MRFSSKRLSDWKWAYIMIMPLMLGLLVFYIWPVFQTFYFSFTDWGAFGKYTWTGLSNYKMLFTDKELLHAIRNTSIYIVLAVPIGIILAILLAVLLNQQVKGLSIYRTMYFLPVVTMPAAIAMVWKWLYNSDIGLINYLLGLLSIPGPHWLTDNRTALLSIIIVAIWCSIGSHMIIFLSGLQGISSSYYEAASIDGAGPVTKFMRITIPLLTPTIFFVLVTSLIGAFQVFDFIYMMVGDIVMESTQSVVFLYYKYGFLQNNKGYASSIAVLLFTIIMIITYIQMKIQKKWVHYE